MEAVVEYDNGEFVFFTNFDVCVMVASSKSVKSQSCLALRLQLP